MPASRWTSHRLKKWSQDDLWREFGHRVAGRAIAKAGMDDTYDQLRALCLQEKVAYEAEQRAAGLDIVVTVPRDRWGEWLAEGDLAGEDNSGREHTFTVYCERPPPEFARRLYILAFNYIRGYAPIARIERKFQGKGKGTTYGKGGWLIVRSGPAVALTVHRSHSGFPGWVPKWWKDEDEIGWPEWRHTHGLRPALPPEGLPRIPYQD